MIRGIMFLPNGYQKKHSNSITPGSYSRDGDHDYSKGRDIEKRTKYYLLFSGFLFYCSHQPGPWSFAVVNGLLLSDIPLIFEHFPFTCTPQFINPLSILPQ